MNVKESMVVCESLGSIKEMMKVVGFLGSTLNRERTSNSAKVPLGVDTAMGFKQ